MKIGGASLVEDMARIEAALKGVGNPADLAVDGNGRFDLQPALAYGHATKDFGLRGYGDAGCPLDFALLAALAEPSPPRLATGQNLFSVSDVRNLVHFGQMRPNFDLFQMDPGLSYGLGEFVKM